MIAISADPDEIVAFMRGSRKFCQRGSNFDGFFFVFFLFFFDEARKDPNFHYKRAIIGPPARHLNSVLLACRCWPNVENIEC